MTKVDNSDGPEKTLGPWPDGRPPRCSRTLFGQGLRLERRNGGATIYARTFLQGRGRVRSTGERTLSAATPIATDWYLDLLARARHGENLHGRSFADLAEVFCLHAEQVREVCKASAGTPAEVEPAQASLQRDEGRRG